MQLLQISKIMTKQLYWIIAVIFVLMATLMGLFIFPYISWLTDLDTELFIILLIIGGVLLIATSIFFFKKNCNKLISMILFPITIFFSLSGLIHLLRFDYCGLSRTYEFNYGNGYYYTKFGFKTEIEGTIIGVAYNDFREKLYISKIVKEEDEWDEYDQEREYKFWVKGVIYDEDGNYVDQTEEKYYFFPSNDHYDYKNRDEIFRNQIKYALHDYGIKMI